MRGDFFDRVEVRSPSECWPWLGATHPRTGHGRVRWDGRVQYASRVSWQIANGPIPEGMFICHTCDNPPCVNPAHLYAGTAADNRGDQVARGREHRQGPKGEKNRHARLTGAAIREIRASDATTAELAARYGVTRQTISRVLRGATWTAA